MKVYTGTGDKGETSLFSGERVSKYHERIEAYGDIDELSSVLGTIYSFLQNGVKDTIDEIQSIQAELLNIGAWMATMPESSAIRHLKEITEASIEKLETSIDRMDESLPALKSFILPGGHPAAAQAHVARTVCRRSERHFLKFMENENSENIISDQFNKIAVYLNRLSDYLFVLARYCNQMNNIPDKEWKA